MDIANLVHTHPNLEELNLSGELINKIPLEIQKFIHLKKLNLSKCNLNRLPEWFANLPLEELDLSSNFFDPFPLVVFNLPNLKVLILDSCKLESLPQEIDKLRTLRKLNISNNSFKNGLPPTLANLSALEIFECAKSHLSDFPSELANLHELHKIDLSKNYIRKIPLKIALLSKLHYLNLLDNRLTEIPASFDHPSFEITRNTLLISKSEITSIPDSLVPTFYEQSADLPFQEKRVVALLNISYGTFPEYLDDRPIDNIGYRVRNNQVVEFVFIQDTKHHGNDILPMIKAFKSCEIVKLGHMGYYKFPDFILELKSLKELDLSYGFLTHIPEKIQELAHLEKLELQENRFTEFPNSILALSHLKYLSLKNNLTSNISPKINQLQNLEYLDLTSSNISDVTFLHLPRLRNLIVKQTSVKSYPPDFLLPLSRCKNLPKHEQEALVVIDLQQQQELRLLKETEYTWGIKIKNNHVVYLALDLVTSLPEEIKSFEYLEYLKISGEISTLPSEIGFLPHLTTFWAEYCAIHKIPDSFANLSALEVFKIEFSNLREFPWFLGILPQLKVVSLGGNRLPDHERILGNDLMKIRKYCQEKIQQHEEELHPEDLV